MPLLAENRCGLLALAAPMTGLALLGDRRGGLVVVARANQGWCTSRPPSYCTKFTSLSPQLLP